LQRLKAWLCYKPCDAGLPGPTPTPCYTPYYALFPCKSGPGYGPACGTAGGPDCAAGKTAGAVGKAAPRAGAERADAGTSGADRHRLLAGRKKADGVPATDCDPKTGPANAGLPGFRFAAPENPAVRGTPHAPTPPVVTTSFRMPSPQK
jgi:hypothetical protein